MPQVRKARKEPSNQRPGTAPSGARPRQTKVKDRWHNYLAHHRSSASDSLQRLLNKPFQSLLTWLVIAVALALPATLKAGLDNLQLLGNSWQGAPQISVFLKLQVRDQAIASFRQRLVSQQDVSDVVYISPAQALQEFEQESGMGNALSSLDNNPLPPTFLVKLPLGLDTERLSDLGEQLRKDPLVDDVVFDRLWLERLNAFLGLGEKLVLALGSLLGLGLILVIGNTIRLAIESRRDEIVIIKLVGGTDAFVRRPFLYTGFWYGLGGGIIALLLLNVLLLLLSSPVESLAGSYQSNFELQGLGFFGSTCLVALAVVVGWLGSWVAVGRHLGDIEPR